MKNKDRLLTSKNKEIIMLGEKLSRVQSERDRLQENLQRYKQGDSFHKMSPKSPSMGIGNKSFEEVTAATVTPKAYSEHEKELILKNGELSFRLKEVEKQNQMLKEMKDNLVCYHLYQVPVFIVNGHHTGTYSGSAKGGE